jgi:sulfur carrier protein
MNVSVNGEKREAVTGATVATLLQEMGIASGAPGVAVAVNGGVVRRKEWDVRALAEGDRLEVIRATQGG